jgi:hypothetical protein
LDVSSITPQAVLAQSAGLTASAFSIGVERKALDMAAQQGAQLAQLMDSTGGVGQNINTYA